MSQVLHTQEIAEYLRSLIWNNFQGAPLSIITCQEGDIAFLASEPDFGDMLPAVFLRPSPGVEMKPRTLQLNQEIVYKFTLVYVRKIVAGENVVKNKTSEINSIAEMLFDYRLMSGLTLTNGRIIYQLPTNVNYEPPEDGFLAAKGMADLIAASINLSVLHYTATP